MGKGRLKAGYSESETMRKHLTPIYYLSKRPNLGLDLIWVTA